MQVRRPNVTRYPFSAFFKRSGFVSKIGYAAHKFLLPFVGDDGALYTVNGLFPEAKIWYVTQMGGDHVSMLVKSAAANLKSAPRLQPASCSSMVT